MAFITPKAARKAPFFERKKMSHSLLSPRVPFIAVHSSRSLFPPTVGNRAPADHSFFFSGCVLSASTGVTHKNQPHNPSALCPFAHTNRTNPKKGKELAHTHFMRSSHFKRNRIFNQECVFQPPKPHTARTLPA